MFLVVLIVGITVGMVMGAAVVGAQDDTVGDRSIAETELAPGESTVVTVDITLDEAAESVELVEEFDPAFGDAAILDADGGIADAADDEAISSWSPAEGDLQLEYEVTVPSDAADGDQFEIDGTVTVDDEEMPISGQTTIEVSEPEEASVTFDSQTTDGESVTVTQAVPGEDGDTLAVWSTEDGEPETMLAVEDDFEAVLEDVSLSLDPPIESDQDLIAAVHSGEPATDNILASDTASVTVEEDDEPGTDEFAERSVEHTELPAGETTTVTVEVNPDETVDTLNWDAEFTPAFADAEFIDTAGADFPTLDSDAGLAQWENVDSLTFIYEVTLPSDADIGETFTFDATITDQDDTFEESVTGDQEIEVIDEPDVEGDLVVEDQASPAGDRLVVETATASVEHAVVVLADGEEIGVSDTFEADETASNLTIEFDQELEETTNVTVQVVSVEDGEPGAPLVTIDGELETTVQLEVGVDAYTAEDGSVGPTQVFEAIEDWRAGEIEPQLVFEVIDAWRGS